MEIIPLPQCLANIVMEYLEIYELVPEMNGVNINLNHLPLNPNAIDSIVKIQLLIDLDTFSENPNFIEFVRNYIEFVDWNNAVRYQFFIKKILMTRFCADLSAVPANIKNYILVDKYFATTPEEAYAIVMSGYEYIDKGAFSNPKNIDSIPKYLSIADWLALSTNPAAMSILEEHSWRAEIIVLSNENISAKFANEICKQRRGSRQTIYYTLLQNKNLFKLDPHPDIHPDLSKHINNIFYHSPDIGDSQHVLTYGLKPSSSNPLLWDYHLEHKNELILVSGRNPNIFKFANEPNLRFNRDLLSKRDVSENPVIFRLVKPFQSISNTNTIKDFMLSSSPFMTKNKLIEIMSNPDISKKNKQTFMNERCTLYKCAYELEKYRLTGINPFAGITVDDVLNERKKAKKILTTFENSQRYLELRNCFIAEHGNDPMVCLDTFSKYSKQKLSDLLAKYKLHHGNGTAEMYLYRLMKCIWMALLPEQRLPKHQRL